MKLFYLSSLATTALAATDYSASCKNIMKGSFSSDAEAYAYTYEDAEVDPLPAAIPKAKKPAAKATNLLANLVMTIEKQGLDRVDVNTLQPKNRIIIMLDKTGSMDGISAETEAAYNKLLSDHQQGDNPDTLYTFIQFDSTMQLTTSAEISEASALSGYDPDGSTALYDAIGCTLHELSNEQFNLMYIISDGEENASNIFSGSAIQQLTQAAQNNQFWDIKYLGANQEAETVGAAMGIADAHDFISSDVGITGALDKVSNWISRDVARKNRQMAMRNRW